MTIIAVLDADALFPMYLRDTLLRLSQAGCFRLHWSERILNEMTRNLVSEHRMAQGGADRLEAKMRSSFPEAMVSDWEPLEADMRNHPKDRHVAAAAVAIQAGVIVTRNVRDFKSLPNGIAAMTPDAFLAHLFRTHPEEVIDALEAQARGYKNPSTTIAKLLDFLGETAPTFAAHVTERAAGSRGSSNAPPPL